MHQRGTRNAVVRGGGHGGVPQYPAGNLPIRHRQHGGVGAFPGEGGRRAHRFNVTDVQLRRLLADDPQLRFGEFKGFHGRIDCDGHLGGSIVAGGGDGGFAHGLGRQHAVFDGDDGRVGALPCDALSGLFREGHGVYRVGLSIFKLNLLRQADGHGPAQIQIIDIDAVVAVIIGPHIHRRTFIAVDRGRAWNRIFSERGHVLAHEHDFPQTGAIIESAVINAGHTCRNGNAVQAGATLECHSADALQAIRKSDAAQAGATFEFEFADAGHALRDRDAAQAAAAIECETINAGHTLRNRDAA